MSCQIDEPPQVQTTKDIMTLVSDAAIRIRSYRSFKIVGPIADYRDGRSHFYFHLVLITKVATLSRNLDALCTASYVVKDR